MPKTTAITADQKLQLSSLKKSSIQREMMGDDLDMGKLLVDLRSQMLFDSTDRVIDIQVDREIAGASTVKITMDDYDRTIIRSWAINAALDVNIDGLWFRLVSVSKTASEDTLEMTFEQREIALLRTYPKPNTTDWSQENQRAWVKWANRSNTTRAEFILNLIREVREINIPVVIPQLQTIQPIVNKNDVTAGYTGTILQANGGIPKDYQTNTKVRPTKKVKNPLPGLSGAVIGNKNQPITITIGKTDQVPVGPLYVKTERAAKDQIDNANTILTVGVNLNANYKVLVCSIMTAIQESDLHNNPGGDGTSVGLFQQIDTGWGSYADRHDPATAAKMFIQQCIKDDASQPGLSYNDLCQTVQNSGHPTLYGQWYNHAVQFVAAFGIPPGGKDSQATGIPGADATATNANNMGSVASATTDKAYYYYRGIPPTRNRGEWQREDNWTCIQRLASEVGWRAFFISGVFYYLTDDDLLKTQPIATVDEQTPGIMGIGFDFDVGKPAATVDMPCQVGLWLAPPGSVVVLNDLGPLDGRWLVNTYSRSLFSPNADINLTKRQPRLPEPLTESFKPPTWGATGAMSGTPNPSLVPSAASTNQALFGGIPGMNNADRKSVVAVAQRALQVESQWHYHYPSDEGGGGGLARPIPASLWSQDAHNAIDCSAFAILCYKEAGCEDPSGNNYDGSGWTGDMAPRGLPVTVPMPGDLAFYGSPPSYHHVAVFIGNNQNIEIGSEAGVHQEPSNSGRFPQYMSYLSRV
jgi:cell wall-associated NlpC family hydrolase